MRILCAPEHFPFKKWDADLNVILYGKNPPRNYGSIGRKIAAVIKAKRLRPSIQAWDFLSIALSIYAADRAGHRNLSYDGWTRNFTLFVAVNCGMQGGCNGFSLVCRLVKCRLCLGEVYTETVA